MRSLLVLFSAFILSSALSASEQSIVLSIPGMNCSLCPITVTKSLQQLDGVKSVHVIYERKIAEVSFDDQLTNISALEQATKNVGYPSHAIKGSNDEK